MLNECCHKIHLWSSLLYKRFFVLCPCCAQVPLLPSCHSSRSWKKKGRRCAASCFDNAIAGATWEMREDGTLYTDISCVAPIVTWNIVSFFSNFMVSLPQLLNMIHWCRSGCLFLRFINWRELTWQEFFQTLNYKHNMRKKRPGNQCLTANKKMDEEILNETQHQP